MGRETEEGDSPVSIGVIRVGGPRVRRGTWNLV